MKNISKQAKSTLTLALFLGWGLFAIAQGPPPPPQNGHGQSTNQPAGPGGGGAPLGGGLAILFSLGAAWGGKKAHQAYKDRDRLI